MTAEEIRIQLCLKPFDEFEYDSLLKLGKRISVFENKQQAINERYRQTGRTTKILCAALARIADGYPVVFLSFSSSSTKIARAKLLSYASLLGLDANLILNYGSNYFDMEKLKGIDQTEIRIFYDHELP